MKQRSKTERWLPSIEVAAVALYVVVALALIATAGGLVAGGGGASDDLQEGFQRLRNLRRRRTHLGQQLR
jgi:hypothetical protein